MFKLFLIAALFFAFTIHSNAQPYYFRKYQVENGLSNNSTICSLQDKNGFLWFGTKDGLNRFDGYTFKVFRNNPEDSISIGNNFIHSIYEDISGIIYVGTESGLYRHNQTSESFKRIAVTINERIRDIIKDNKGYLWFISGFTLIKFDEGYGTYEMFEPGKYFEATSICVSKDGSLWTSTSAGDLKKYNSRENIFTSFNLFEHSKPAVNKWIDKICYSAEGNILAGTSNQGVKLFNVNALNYKDILTYNEDRTEIFARNFFETSPGVFWIATETGVYIYNLKTGQKLQLQKKLNDPYSISDNAVYTFCRDKEGGMWVGTYFGGINYYPKQSTIFKKYFPKFKENSLQGNVVREIHEDKTGNLWIGTEDAGLNKFENNTGKFKNFSASGNKGDISYNNIHGLLVDGDNLWVGTFEHGVDILDIKTEKVIQHFAMGAREHSLKSNFIYCITKLNSGEIILGTTRGAYSYNKSSKDFSLLHGMPLNNWYTCITKDSKGIIWAGTYGNGVNFYNTATKKAGNFNYSARDYNSLSSDRINSIFEDSNKDLWFATEGGLCKLNKKTNDFKRYSTKNGLPSDFILSILEDNYKNLWISTSKGLVRLSITTENIVTYTVENGLLNNQFNFNSAYKDKEGRMYFGSVKGLISFKPEEFVEDNFVPPVYITSFQVYNKDIDIARKGSPLTRSITYTQKIVLDYNESTINIGFAALSYTAPDMTEYAYKMEGLDKGWTYLKRNRNAYLTHLDPGTYIFKVKATNSSGKWNNQEKELTIEILPPWWASKWAYAVYALLTVFTIYSCFRYYHKRIELKNKRKFQRLESLKEREVFKAKLEFFTNVAHEIRTPLTLIKGPLEKVIKKAQFIPEIQNHLKIMDRNTTRLIDLTNQLLDFRQTEIEGYRLAFVKADIAELLEETFYNFKPLAEAKNLSYTLNFPGTGLFAYVDLDAFNKILNNLFSNAVKYAESKVEVSLQEFSKAGNIFTIEVKNDGFLIPAEMKDKIFEPFFRLKETQKQKGTGIGLALSQSLVQLHKGILNLKEQQENLNIFSLTLPIDQEVAVTLEEITDSINND